MIEDHWHEIAERTVQEIRRDPDLPTVSTRPDSELYEWCRDILKNLGYWLSASKADEVAHRFGALGRLRYEESVPLHEAVHRFHLLKYKMIEFVREHGFAENSLQGLRRGGTGASREPVFRHPGPQPGAGLRARHAQFRRAGLLTVGQEGALTASCRSSGGRPDLPTGWPLLKPPSAGYGSHHRGR
jgi:hypothetical protein